MVRALKLARQGRTQGYDIFAGKQQPEPVIIVLSAGKPNIGVNSISNILTAVGNANAIERVPIFSLVFRETTGYDLLRQLARENYGVVRNIYEDLDIGLQLKDFYDGISSFLVSNVTFNNTKSEVRTPYKIIFIR